MKQISHLQEIIFDRINSSTQQRISFAEYMDLALYHPQYGYYSSGIVEIGARGDFFTSSSLGVDFGELLGEQFREIWQIMGCPEPFMLVEMGAGQGLLAQDILNYLQKNYPQLLKILEYIIVEESPSLIDRQREKLQVYLDQKINITWQDWSQIASDSIVGCCFSNELLDAFPVHQVIIKDDRLQEIYLTVKNGELTEVSARISTPKLAEYFPFIGIELPASIYPDGYRTEVNLAALDWLKTISDRLQRGYLLTIDYGYNADRYYHPQRREGTLQCYFQHRRHNNPYLNIGLQDITTHINFTALERQGELCGLTNWGFTQQGMFLMSLGLGDRLHELSSGKYNVQQIMQRRDALHQLIDPTGLGGFGVLIQSKGIDRGSPLLNGLIVPQS